MIHTALEVRESIILYSKANWDRNGINSVIRYNVSDLTGKKYGILRIIITALRIRGNKKNVLSSKSFATKNKLRSYTGSFRVYQKKSDEKLRILVDSGIRQDKVSC